MFNQKHNNKIHTFYKVIYVYTKEKQKINIRRVEEKNIDFIDKKKQEYSIFF